MTCLIFFALPFLLIIVGFGKKWEARERESIERIFDSLDSAMMATRTRDDPSTYLKNILDRLADKANASKSPFPILNKGLKNLRERFPGVFRFYVVGPNGALIPDLTEPGIPGVALKKMYHFQKNIDRVPVQESEFGMYWMVMKSFVGDSASPISVKKTRHYFNAGLGKENHFFFFAALRKFGLYAHLTLVPEWEWLAIVDSCKRFRKRHPDSKVTLSYFNLLKPIPDFPGLREAWKKFRKDNINHIVQENSLFGFMPFSRMTYIWASCSRENADSFLGRRLIFWGFGVLLFSFLVVKTHRVMVFKVPMKFSMRWRLISLFGFASGLPIAVIIFAGWDYADQTYRNRVRETHEDHERFLRTFDAQMQTMLSQWEKRLTLLLSTCHADTPKGLERTKGVVDYIKRSFNDTGSVLFNKKGEYVHGKKSEVFGFKFLAALSRKVLLNLNHEPETAGIDSSSLILETMLNMGSNSPLDDIAGNLGKIFPLSLGAEESWAYAYPIFSKKDNKATHLVYADWRKTVLDRFYVVNRLEFAQRKSKGLLLFASNQNRSEFVPANVSKDKAVVRFFRDLSLRQGTTFGRIRRGRDIFLITGIKPKELATHYLCAMESERKILLEVNLLEKRLWALSIISGIISLFLGYLLSMRFLTPIGHLSQAVEAINQRHFEHRLPPGEQDELGELAATFNHVMEGLSELEVARIVQESLLPSGEIKTGDYRIFGKTVTSTELGGDYFELETFPDGRILILIGDVTGHGVPAALVMAMAKALVATRTFEGNNAPESILDLMHKVIFKTLKRKRLMTCFAGLLDPAKHIFYFSNAGHNFPYYISPGKPPVYLEVIAGPLGSKRVINFGAASIPFLPGDKILFYTDGLVEQKDQGGDMIGYAKMISNVAPMLSDDPCESYEKIFAWYQAVLGKQHQEDDLTIVLLSRNQNPSA